MLRLAAVDTYPDVIGLDIVDSFGISIGFATGNYYLKAVTPTACYYGLAVGWV